MDRGHTVREGQLLGMGLLALPRSPCFSRACFLVCKEGQLQNLLAVSGCKSLPPEPWEQPLSVCTMPGSSTQGREAPTSAVGGRSR